MKSSGRPTGNILGFCISALFAGLLLLVLVFDGNHLIYHDSSEGSLSVGVFLAAIMGVLIGFIHLLNSLPDTSSKKGMFRFLPFGQSPNTSRSAARGSLFRVGVLIAIFATIGAIGYVNTAFVLSQPTPSDSDLYLTRGFTMQANSSTIPTTTTYTWAVPSSGIDDLKVYVLGVATAPCGNPAVIDFSVAITYNGSIIFSYPERHSKTQLSNCSGSNPSKATLSSSRSGLPVTRMGSITITLALFPHAWNTNASLDMTIYKVNDLNLLYLDKGNVCFMYGSLVVVGWFYSAVATITLLVGLKRLRSWKKDDPLKDWKSTRVWSRDDTTRNNTPPDPSFTGSSPWNH